MAALVAIVAASVLPSAAVFADALNPLTERSLTLSSSSPGWSFTDGSGNSTYAQPNSGANGNKTGNTFSFRVSSGTDIKGLSFQYCTTSAGDCMGPGNNTVSGTSPTATRAANGDTEYGLKHSDLEVKTASPSAVTTWATKFDQAAGAPSSAANVPNADNSEGNFIVLHKAPADANWTESTGWSMAASVNQTVGGVAGDALHVTSTEKNNYITLTNASGQSIDAGDYVKVIFFGTDTNYIINPGAGAFFVKINTYNSDSALTAGNIIDGGVTVANVMNRSIEIQTKVLETMDFSVGTVDPYTMDSTQLQASSLAKATHGTCDRILTGMTTDASTGNILKMGNQTGENSLETDKTYSTHSYWRLSSNSSAGATVYYAGVTLSNTVGDQIDPINGGNGTKTAPTPGSEQFGLALANGDGSDVDAPNNIGYLVNYKSEDDASKLYEDGADKTAAGIAALAGLTGTGTGIHSSTTTDVGANQSYHTPQLYPLVPKSNYMDGAGTVNNNYASGSDPVSTAFAFKSDSNLVPEPIADEGNQVVDCVTGKMRYVANIAATTPAGIYTTKINYIAAPQY
jgi:hypothetical protein